MLRGDIMKKKHNKKITNDKEGAKMAATTKPSVFEISVKNTEYSKVKNTLDEVRLTKSFLAECLDISKKLKKDNTNK